MDFITQISLALFAIPAGNYSGIAPMGGEEYVIVDDKAKDDAFKVLNISIDEKKGKVIGVTMKESSVRDVESVAARDYEGVAFCKQRGAVFVSGEADQQILEYGLDGEPTGAKLDVPECFSLQNIRSNYGFESLTYNAVTQRFWTTSESTLKSDGESSSLQHRDTRNRLRLQSFGLDMKPNAMYAYEMDAPTVKKKKGQYFFGVPSMLATDDGRLIVMEREAFVAKRYFGSFCRIKLYEVDVNGAVEINEKQSLVQLPASAFVNKRLLCEFKTGISLFRYNFANFEGMCFGPQLADGSQTLFMIADSQGRYGNSLYRLKDYLRVMKMSK